MQVEGNSEGKSNKEKPLVVLVFTHTLTDSLAPPLCHALCGTGMQQGTGVIWFFPLLSSPAPAREVDID